jgi:vacuolar-type H+-ATPase subunit F/Vma7
VWRALTSVPRPPAPMATTTAYKDRNLLAVIGDEVCAALCPEICARSWRIAGLGDRAPPRRRRAHRRQPEEELPRRRRQCVSLFPVSIRVCSSHCSETQVATIEAAFQDFTERKDVAILLINQHVCPPPIARLPPVLTPRYQIAEKIRATVDKYTQAFPALLEIPSKDHPYGPPPRSPPAARMLTHVSGIDPSKDSILKRVKKLFGE